MSGVGNAEPLAAGQPATLRLDAAGPGLIRIRGDGIQGIDWPAPGRSTVTVPLLAYRDLPEDFRLTTGGHVIDSPLPLRSSAEGKEPPPGPVVDDDAYQLAALWQPGQPDAVRHWTMLAAGVAVLVLGIAAHADPKRATFWLIGAGVGLSAGVVWCFPVAAQRRVLPADGRPGWEWVWHATSSAQTIEEPWSPGLRFVPASRDQLKQADPILRCDAAGRPVSISVTLGQDGRAVFLRKRVSSSSPG